MRVVEIIADVPVSDLAGTTDFYGDYLGLSRQDLGLDWVTRFVAPTSGAQLQLVTRDATAPENPILSIKVDDVDAAYAEAGRRGFAIVHPLTTEPWGVRRFLVRTPAGSVINILRHRS